MDRTRGKDVVAAASFEGELFDIEVLLMVESAIGFLMLL